MAFAGGAETLPASCLDDIVLCEQRQLRHCLLVKPVHASHLQPLEVRPLTRCHDVTNPPFFHVKVGRQHSRPVNAYTPGLLVGVLPLPVWAYTTLCEPSCNDSIYSYQKGVGFALGSCGDVSD